MAGRVITLPSCISMVHLLDANNLPAFISDLFQLLPKCPPDTWPPPLESCCLALPASPKSGSPWSPKDLMIVRDL